MDAPQQDYPRIALGFLLLAAAVPWRYYGSFPLVASLSVLDVAVVAAAGVLLARHAMLPSPPTVDVWPVVLVAVLPALCVASLVWTADVPATIRESVSYAEGMVALAFAMQQTRGMSPERIVRLLRRFLYVLLVPPALLLAQVPGFLPQQPDLSISSGDYLSYFSRLSHPFMGRSNNLATVLLILCVVLVYWAITRHHPATYVAALVCVIAVFLTISRGAIVALLAAALFFLLLGPRPAPRDRRRLVVASGVFALCLAVAGAAFYLFNPATQTFIGGRVSLENVLGRESRVAIGMDYLLRQPWLGYGAGTTPLNDPLIGGGVHNTYLQQLLAYGVVLGFVAVLSLLGLAHHFLRRQAAGLRRAVGLTMVAVLVNLLVESSFEGSALRVIMYLLFGMLVGLVLAHQEAARPSPERERDALSPLPAPPRAPAS